MESEPSPANGKAPCHLWRLPRELRDLIYLHLFCSTRLSHGISEIVEQDFEYSCVEPSGNSLAVLRTCGTVKNDIGDRWMSQVLFNFEDVETMMNMLTGIPHEKLAKIRHLRVRGSIFREWLPVGRRIVLLPGFQYSLAHYMSLIPGLRLDTLTVLDSYLATDLGASFDSVTTLIKYGLGWKELRVITRDTILLEYDANKIIASHNALHYGNGFAQLRPYPWFEVINDRDGRSSQPTLNLYQYRQMDLFPFSMEKAMQYPYYQSSQNLSETGHPGFVMNHEWDMDLLIMVSRGKGLAFQESQETLFLRLSEENNTSQWETSWTDLRMDLIEIQRTCEARRWSIVRPESRPVEGLHDLSNEAYRLILDQRDANLPRHTDKYNDPDEYELEQVVEYRWDQMDFDRDF